MGELKQKGFNFYLQEHTKSRGRLRVLFCFLATSHPFPLLYHGDCKDFFFPVPITAPDLIGQRVEGPTSC